jgi:hypothetical protein
MHSFLSRVNFVVTYTLSIFAAVTFLLAISTQFVSLSPQTSSSAKVYAKDLKECGIVTFDLQANLSANFNWNVKEL